MKIKGRSGSGSNVCTTAAVLLMHLRLVVGSGPFSLLLLLLFLVSCSYCMPVWSPGLPCLSIRSRDCTTPPGTANQDVSIILLCRADLAFLSEGGGLDEWVWMLRVTCRVMYSKWLV